MQKIDVYSLPRVERKPETRTFTEPETGLAVELTLRACDVADAAAANEVAERLAEDYITGSDIREAGPFPDPEVKPSRQLFNSWATVAEMQPELVYDAVELIILASKAPTIGAEIMAWAQRLNAAREKARGK